MRVARSLSLEEVRVEEVEDPVAVGPTNDYAFAVAPDNGAGAGVRTAAGGLADIGPQTVNSRRIVVYAPDGVTVPTVDTGDHFTGTIEGIMTEYEGNPELDMTASSAVGVSHGLTPQVAPPARFGQLGPGQTQACLRRAHLGGSLVRA